MPADHLLGQAELAADVAHLVLEQLAQRLDELELHVRLEPADVVVRLDRRPTGRRAATQLSITSGYSVPCTRNFASLPTSLRRVLEHVDERVADDLALLLGILDARERVEEALRRVAP